jgi:hypothetical protein
VWVRDAERRQFVEREAGMGGKADFEFAELPYGPFSAARASSRRGAMAAGTEDRGQPLDEFHGAAAGRFPRRKPHATKCLCNVHDLNPLVHPEFTPKALGKRGFSPSTRR